MTNIFTRAFYDNDNITGVYIPSSVVQIDQMAFACCSYIEEVTFGENSELYWISSNAFYDCTYLSEIYLPAALEHIGEGAFRGGALRSVVIPKSVYYIDQEAFDSCYYITIYYCGSESGWSDISIDSYNDEIYGSVIYYNCIVGG